MPQLSLMWFICLSLSQPVTFFHFTLMFPLPLFSPFYFCVWEELCDLNRDRLVYVTDTNLDMSVVVLFDRR